MKEQFNCMFWKVLLILSHRHHDEDFLFKSDKMSMLPCMYLLYQKSIRFFSLSFIHVLFVTLSVTPQCGLVKFFLHFILYKQITWVKSRKFHL